jgi:PIN domain nuclease of toxin-antitoxin system
MQERLSVRARESIEAGDPRVSPMVLLELAFLHEVGRARDPAKTMLAALRRDVGVQMAEASFDEIVRASLDISWVRNPFDRLIVAHAIVAAAPLVTADRTILENLPQAIWD